MEDCGELTTFRSSLRNTHFLLFFEKYLKDNFCSENLYFWLEAERYKTFREDIYLRKANYIFRKYIKPGAVCEINIDSELKKQLQTQMLSPDASLFIPPQEAIYQIMETDLFPKFTRTPLYKECLKEYSKSLSCQLEPDSVTTFAWFARRIDTPGVKIQCLCAVGNGTRVWGGSNTGSIFIWDVENGNLFKELKGVHTKRVNCLLAVNDYVWSGSEDSIIHIWSKNGELLKSFQLTEPILTFYKEKGREEIYVGTIANFQIWNPQDYTIVNQLELGPVIVITADESGLWLGTDQNITLLDKTTHEVLDQCKAHNRPIKSMVESNGNVWTCSDHASICVWKCNDNKILHVKTIDRHEARVWCLGSVGEKTIWSGSFDTNILIWDQKAYGLLQRIQHHTDTISTICEVDDGVVWVASHDKSISAWFYSIF